MTADYSINRMEMAATSSYKILGDAAVFTKGMLKVAFSMVPIFGGPISMAREMLKDVQRHKDKAHDMAAIGQPAANALEILEFFAQNADILDAAAQNSVYMRIEELRTLLLEMRDAVLAFGESGFYYKHNQSLNARQDAVSPIQENPGRIARPP